jgi:hypothetical protein
MERRLTRMERHVEYVEEYLSDEVDRRNNAVRWVEDLDRCIAVNNSFFHDSIQRFKDELMNLSGAIYGGRRNPLPLRAPDEGVPVPAPVDPDRPRGRERFIPPDDLDEGSSAPTPGPALPPTPTRPGGPAGTLNPSARPYVPG